jgi:hypothetical protein
VAKWLISIEVILVEMYSNLKDRRLYEAFATIYEAMTTNFVNLPWKPMTNKSWQQPLVALGIVGIALAGVMGIQQHQLARNPTAEDPRQVVQQDALQLSLLQRSPAFGFDNMMANWAFLQFAEYFGDDEARNVTGYGLSPQYFDLITQRDPRFLDVYPFLSSSISYQLGRPELAIPLMERGTRALSPQINERAFQVWRFMGLDQLLLLGDVPASIRSHEMAAKWVEGTSFRDFRPLFLGTAEFLRSNPDSRSARIASWATVYQQAVDINDQKTQERAKQEITRLGGTLTMQDGQVLLTMPAEQPTPQKPN